MKHSEWEWQSSDRVGLYRQSWAPASDAKAVITLVHGGADPITSAAASREFAAKAPQCTFKAWDGFYHEIHNEPEQQQLFAAITAWLNARVPPLSIPAAKSP